MLSMWRSMGPGWRSSELPKTARTMCEPTIVAEAIMRVSCSSAVPSFGSNIFEVGQIDFIPISTSMLSFSAYCRTCAEVRGIKTADEANLGKVNHLGAMGRAVIQVLEGRPILRAQAEEVDSGFDGGGGKGSRSQRGGRAEREKFTSGHGRARFIVNLQDLRRFAQNPREQSARQSV